METFARARFVVCVGYLVVIGLSHDVMAQAPASRTVLLLHEHSDVGGALRARFDAAFTEAVRANTTDPVELYAETMESDRFPGAEQTRVFRDYLTKKYAGLKIDVIVADGFRPLLFAKEYRHLFGNPPIVTTVAQPGQLNSEANIVGLQGGFWAGETVSLATHLLPDTRNVYVIDGTADNNGDIEQQVRRQLRERFSGLTVVYLRDLTLADLLARVTVIPPHSIVVFIRQTIGTPAQNLDASEALGEVLRVSPAPVFTLFEEFLGRGILGGEIWRFETDARRVAAMAMLIANGTSPREIMPGRNTYETILDWQQLQRWRIPESRIPAGSTVRFRPRSFLSVYGGYVLTGAALFTAQFALIVGLLAQRARRRRAEQEVRTHATLYRSVVDAQSDLICRFLPDTTLTFVNDAYCRFWNKSREELLGHPFVELIPEYARASVIDRFERMREGPVTPEDPEEVPVCLPDGTQGWHLWIHSAIVDQQGRVIEFQAVGRDVTDRKRAELALRSAEARNTAILRAIPDLMFVMRRDGTYVDYHARDRSLLFVPPEQFLGKTVREIMPPDIADSVMDALERACATGEPVGFEYELTLGEVRYFEARLVPSGPDQVLSIVRDVSDARRARDLNRALAGRLIVSQEEERQRIARELHDDLSQKIAVLNIDVDRLAHQLPTPDHRTWLRRISTQVAEIASHLHDLSYELHPARLQTLGLLESLRVMCSDFSEQRQLAVSFSANDNELPLVIDPAVSLCVYRIAQEALHNVARHSRVGRASVRLTYEAGDLCLQIVDSGVGFEAQSSGHAGLGLVSMRERVAVLNGTLTIHSAPGRGTRIVARVPLPVPQYADAASQVSVTAGT